MIYYYWYFTKGLIFLKSGLNCSSLDRSIAVTLKSQPISSNNIVIFFPFGVSELKKFNHSLTPNRSLTVFEEVVNSNLYFSSGFAYLKHPLAARAPS